jgi:hypothetical protein
MYVSANGKLRRLYPSCKLALRYSAGGKVLHQAYRYVRRYLAGRCTLTPPDP